jgi:hypothetical protein
MAVIQQTKYELLPVGEYAARIESAELTEGNFGEQVETVFAIVGGAHDGATLKYWTSKTFSPKSRLYELARSAFAAEIPEDYALDTRHPVGRMVTITIIVRAKDDGSEFNRVDRVRSLRQGENGRSPGGPTAPPSSAPPAPPSAPPAPPMFEDDIPF